MDGFSDAFHEAKKQFAAAGALVPGADLNDPWPFQCLGHDRGRFFVYTTEGRQVLSLSAKDLSSHGELMKLGRLAWFEANYPGREAFNARQAANEIMRACYKQGVFSPDVLRGRGVWLDDGRRVVHLGDRLLVDGIPTRLENHQSASIYEQASPLDVTLGVPLSDAEGAAILRTCQALALENPERDGALLAGWIVSAMIGGALHWRPHLWMLGEAGGGKTWTMDNLVRPMLGPLAVVLQGKTTEAGIRGKLGYDARPVLFDEAETQSDMDRARMQQAIDLARQASSDDSGAIVKGTKDGGARSYVMRASFLFSSINAGLTQSADESRFATISLTGGSADQFANLKASHAAAMVENVNGRLLARVLAMVPTIRANADRLAEAIARTGAGRRAGDTIGTLIACQMALESGEQLTAETAAAYLAARQWLKDAAQAAKAQPEYERALAHLMQQEGMRRTVNGRNEALTISELVSACYAWVEEIDHREADATLRRLGMRVMDGRLLIGNRSSEVGKRFANTPWGAGWSATLARLPDAKRGIPTRFTPGYQDKALSLPLSYIMGGA